MFVGAEQCYKYIHMVLKNNIERTRLEKVWHLGDNSSVRFMCLYKGVLIESDEEAKTILDPIPIINIRNLVSNYTRKFMRVAARKAVGTSIKKDITLHRYVKFI